MSEQGTLCGEPSTELRLHVGRWYTTRTTQCDQRGEHAHVTKVNTTRRGRPYRIWTWLNEPDGKRVWR